MSVPDPESLSKRIVGAFHLIPEQAPVRDYQGPWNKLLNYLFPPDSPYTVIPRDYYPIVATKEQSGLAAVDAENQPQLWFAKFEVQYESLPVLLVLVATPAVVGAPLARKLADTETRRQVAALQELCPLPKMRAICAFGPFMCLFTSETTSSESEVGIQPPKIDAGDDSAADVAPRDRWSSFLTPEGQIMVLEVVQQIKKECEAEG
ncbi:hypothetical protein DFP72DRAFT_1166824 [Ephemerocybe angulata]|uniref:Uncharacterized protein n=1 Tax=Ephemerocybe angulata TaxID=980116 RepID=A0A8H6MB07_9AGAR|nr:hypothetical protein DFP72DRAFT_1166824 [Tulosesus angulatus]